MSVEVIIGHHADDDEHRTASRHWVSKWYESRGYSVTVSAAHGAVWCKADAYNQSVADSAADVVVLADADSWPMTDALTMAVDRVGVTGWSVPFTRVRRLTVEATQAALDCDPVATDSPPDRHVESDVHDVLPGGGIVVMRRGLALDCGPFDPRFRGYGGEDFALGNAARTLAGAYATIVTGTLWHLWHPRTATFSHDTKHLANRYRMAKFDKAATVALIDEWRRDGTA